MCFTATSATTVATHTSLENKQVSVPCLRKIGICNKAFFLADGTFVLRLEGDVPHGPGKPDMAVKNP